MENASFLIFDDTSENFFIARRTAAQIKPVFHNMKVGEVRMLTDTIGVEREK